MTTISQAWAIWNDPTVKFTTGKWEHAAGCDCASCQTWNADKHYPYGSGLCLEGCPHCGKFETRETYVEGFWAETFELVTDYTCYGVVKCQCGQWLKWSS